MTAEQRLEGQLLYDGKVLQLYRDKVKLENGKTAVREVVKHHGGVGILPIDEDGNCYLVRQYRYGAGETLLEMPAGKLERGEEPLACGIRELAEEVGLAAEKITPLGLFYPTPAYCSEKIHLFVAQKLTVTSQKLDDDEFLEIVKMPLEQAVTLAQRGDILDAKTCIALLRWSCI